jgi:hypothetical protein
MSAVSILSVSEPSTSDSAASKFTFMHGQGRNYFQCVKIDFSKS